MIQKKHPGKIKEPVLAYWEHVGESVVQFLQHENDHMKFVEVTKNTYEVGHARCDTASDFVRLVREDVVLTIACYLRGFCIVRWFPCFNVLKKMEPITSRSGCVSCHMAISYYKMQQDIEELELIYEIKEEFLPF